LAVSDRRQSAIEKTADLIEPDSAETERRLRLGARVRDDHNCPRRVEQRPCP